MNAPYLIARYLYRPVSVRVARVLVELPITPVQVTWSSFALALGGAAAFGVGAYALGAALTLLGILTDCVDGDLARLRGESSRAGAFLDSILDRWTDAALILGLALSDPDRHGVAAGLALTGSLLTSYTRARAQSLGVDSADGIGGRDTRMLVLVIGGFTGFIQAGLWIVAILGTTTSIQRALVAGRALGRIDVAESSPKTRLDNHVAGTERTETT